MKTKFKVQKLVTLKPYTNNGHKLGRVWVTVGPREGYGRIATAEHIQHNIRIDEPNTEVRLVETIAPVAREKAVW
jgi:hypothetical protein